MLKVRTELTGFTCWWHELLITLHRQI